MQFSKYIITVASIATIVAAIPAMATSSQRSVAGDSSEDKVERSESPSERIEGKFKNLESEIREHFRKDDSQEDATERAARKADREARIAKIRGHFDDMETDLKNLEDRVEAKRDKEIAEAKAEYEKLTKGDAQEDATERAARKQKMEDLKEYIVSNARNDVRIVRGHLHKLHESIEAREAKISDRLTYGDAQEDAVERQERDQKFNAEVSDVKADFREMKLKFHEKKDWFRVHVLGISPDHN